MEIQADSILNKVKHNEEVMKTEVEKSTNLAGSSGSLNSYTFNSVSSCHDGEEEDYGEDVSDYGDDDDHIFENDDDDYLRLQAEFDNIKLPPGVEASVSWLMYPLASTSLSAEAGTSNVAINNCKYISASEGNEEKSDTEALVIFRFEQFKRFDLVVEFSDHHYISKGFNGQQPPKNWTKKVQDEWKILEENLPDTIYVRVCETRMDLLRAVIVGSAGTPYHDGLFTFDVLFPPTYPEIPPMVYYHSGGLRLNPNLYDNGKVCLSLLGTWSGKGRERWMPNQSTMLQVLVSVQALILNTNPFFNEPGYDLKYRGAEGKRRSKEYNEEVFILSLKTMMYTLRRPPKHFEDLVTGHFHTCAHAILSACKAYMEGAQVGSAAEVSEQDDANSRSKEFKATVGMMVNGLVTNFSKYTEVDCDQFRVEGEIYTNWL